MQSRGAAKALCRSIRGGGRYHSCEDAESDAAAPRLCQNRYAILRVLYHRICNLKLCDSASLRDICP